MAAKKLSFKNGDFVVYPTVGVGKLLRTEEQSVGGQKITLLVIEFERNRMTLRVPVDRAEISGLRPLASPKELNKIIESARDKPVAKRLIWARRSAQYEESINSGDPARVADVLRDLRRREPTDMMNFSARGLYLRALERMAQEYAILHKIDLDSATLKIEDMMGVPPELDLNAVDEDLEEELEEDSE
ncbi:MAG: CarD family transcriptional regulator [Rickettsiales bacterium]|jgi:CarD family transcriptional regulator|nr:CarD family transcriptional regulator [Rickettsiales bacterium]